MPGPIDQAIAAALADPPVGQQTYGPVTVKLGSSGRYAAIAVPAGMTDAELLDLLGWMTTGLRIEITKQRGPALLIPQGRPT